MAWHSSEDSIYWVLTMCWTWCEALYIDLNSNNPQGEYLKLLSLMAEIISMVSNPESDSVFTTQCHLLNQHTWDVPIKCTPSLINTSHTGKTVLSHRQRAGKGESRGSLSAVFQFLPYGGHACYCSKVSGSSTSSGQKNGKDLVIW